ncbi:MAG: Ribosome-recycling factor [Phycisphaerae bacterium]|nr:Ribosome-recycling factor [Phycisphaerae bacterium]
MTLDQIQKDCRKHMDKAIEFLQEELRGIRTGRASPGLIEHVKVHVTSYNSTMDLRELAMISAPEPTQLLIKPFDPGTIRDIDKAIQASNLGLTPMVDGATIRLPIPPLSGERRKHLINEIKRMAEAQKVAIRNARRDANKHLDSEEKAATSGEDVIEAAKEEIQKMLKKYEGLIDQQLAAKQKELETV